MSDDFYIIKSKPIQSENFVLWTNDEETKIPIVDGKIRFRDYSTGAYYELYVKQVKGRGVADADKLETLSPKHIMVIERLKEIGWDMYTSEQILTILQDYHNKHGKEFKQNPYKRTISELFRRKILIMTQVNPPKYALNMEDRKSTRLNSSHRT